MFKMKLDSFGSVDKIGDLDAPQDHDPDVALDQIKINNVDQQDMSKARPITLKQFEVYEGAYTTYRAVLGSLIGQAITYRPLARPTVPARPSPVTGYLPVSVESVYTLAASLGLHQLKQDALAELGRQLRADPPAAARLFLAPEARLHPDVRGAVVGFVIAHQDSVPHASDILARAIEVEVAAGGLGGGSGSRGGGAQGGGHF